MLAVSLGVAGCQALTGLDDLETGPSAGTGGGGTTTGATTATTGGGSSSTSSASTAGGGGAATSSSSSGGGGNDCPAPIAPTACSTGPMLCPGICVAPDTCAVACGQSPGCNLPPPNGNTVACGPPTSGYACEITCLGACAGKTIECPASAPCEVMCNAPGSCFGATITCHDGPCHVTCNAGACDGSTQLNCGTQECVATCAGASSLSVPPSGACYVDVASCQ